MSVFLNLICGGPDQVRVGGGGRGGWGGGMGGVGEVRKVF